MRSPQITGDDQPRPGIFDVQTTFSVRLHVSGRSVSSLTPRDPGPRNWGQLSAAAAVDDWKTVPTAMQTAKTTASRTNARIMLQLRQDVSQNGSFRLGWHGGNCQTVRY